MCVCVCVCVCVRVCVCVYMSAGVSFLLFVQTTSVLVAVLDGVISTFSESTNNTALSEM